MSSHYGNPSLKRNEMSTNDRHWSHTIYPIFYRSLQVVFNGSSVTILSTEGLAELQCLPMMVTSGGSTAFRFRLRSSSQISVQGLVVTKCRCDITSRVEFHQHKILIDHG